MKSYAVIGLGRFGRRIAERLYAYGEDVLVIDRSENTINEIADRVTKAVCADATDKGVLKRVGVQDCDCAIVGLGSDLASSILITMSLKNMGVPMIICKAFDETHREILEKIGADQVILAEKEVADKMARTLASPGILESIELSTDYGIVEYRTPAGWVGKSIRELDIRARYGVNVIAIEQKNGDIDVSPDPNAPIESDMILVLLGDYGKLEKIQKMK